MVGDRGDEGRVVEDFMEGFSGVLGISGFMVVFDGFYGGTLSKWGVGKGMGIEYW